MLLGVGDKQLELCLMDLKEAMQAAAPTDDSADMPEDQAQRVVGLWCKLSQPTQRSAREHYAAYAARTAFQIPGAVLPLMRSFPSLN